MVQATAKKAAEGLDWAVTKVRETLEQPDAKYNDKLASHLAYLSSHVIQMVGELRKLDAGIRAQIKKLTPEQEFEACLEYVRELPVEKRADLRNLIEELEGETSLLGHDTRSVGDEDEEEPIIPLARTGKR